MDKSLVNNRKTYPWWRRSNNSSRWHSQLPSLIKVGYSWMGWTMGRAICKPSVRQTTKDFCCRWHQEHKAAQTLTRRLGTLRAWATPWLMHRPVKRTKTDTCKCNSKIVKTVCKTREWQSSNSTWTHLPWVQATGHRCSRLIWCRISWVLCINHLLWAQLIINRMLSHICIHNLSKIER